MAQEKIAEVVLCEAIDKSSGYSEKALDALLESFEPDAGCEEDIFVFSFPDGSKITAVLHGPLLLHKASPGIWRFVIS